MTLKHARWQIRGTLTTTAPLHIGSGDITTYGHPSLKNDQRSCEIQAVVQDHLRQPCIPGTALKGVLRSWAERSLPTETGPIARIFGLRDVRNASAEAGWAEFCTAFVQPSSDTQRQAFADTVPYWYGQAESELGPTRTLYTGVLSHVCLDRTTGAAAHNKLYYEEFVPAGVSFGVEINASRLTKDEVAFLLGLLEQGAAHPLLPLQFGANGADGWGRMTWRLNRVQQCPKPELPQGKVGFAACTQSAPLTPASLNPQTPPHWTGELRLKLPGPFVVNDASRAKQKGMTEAEQAQHANFTPLRDAAGHVWLPASSLRGALRARSEFLLRSLDASASGDPNQPAGDGPIERLFGATGQAARLLLEEPHELLQYGVSSLPAAGRQPHKQDFVAIDRFLGGAADGAKFDAHYADRPQFTTRLTLLASRGPAPDSSPPVPDPEAADFALLLAALDDLCAGHITLGWGGAKGYGHASGEMISQSHAQLPNEWKQLLGDDPAVDPRALRQQLLQGLVSESTNEPQSLTQAPRTAPRPAPTPPAKPSPAPAPQRPLQSGVLVMQKTKRGHDFTLKYQNKGQPKFLKVKEADLVPELCAGKSPEVAVEFEWEGNSPVLILPAGSPRGAPAKVPAADSSEQAPGVNDFLHPYYFLRLKDPAKFPPNALQGHSSDVHRRWLPGRYSGTLKITLTVKTPLLICDDARRTEDTQQRDHFIYPLKTQDGLPALAASSVRGLLRSAYEAITNSRFGVFPFKPEEEKIAKRAHARRHAYRMTAEDGLSVVPVRIEGGKAVLLLGENPGLPVFNSEKKKWQVPGGLLHAAWAPQYLPNSNRQPDGAVKIAGKAPQHGQRAWCWLERVKHNRKPFGFWRVRQAAQRKEELSTQQPSPSPATDSYTSQREFIQREGVFVISNQNIKNKHDERFFFGLEQEASCEPAVLSNYYELIADCQQLHAKEVEARSKRNPPQSPAAYTPSQGQNAEVAALSRHSYDLQAAKPEANPVWCYAFVQKQGEKYLIKALYPVTISRKLYDLAPLDLLPKSLQPAATVDELSPADRVFGWVNQDADQAQGAAVAAWRGQLRVGPVRCLSTAAEAVETFPAKSLAILGQPKPQQGRFYLGDKNGKAQATGLTKEQAGYTNGQNNRIRGPKVYPHHPQAEEYRGHDEWAKKNPQAFSQERSDQNRSVTGWVKPGAKFACELQFLNLSAVELGALLWLLSLPEQHFLRLGLGKPLGFGSVRAELAEGSQIADGSEWIAALTHPQHTLQQPNREQLQATFVTEINRLHPTLLASYQRVAQGLGNAPVHYPLVEKQPLGGGETFQWFVANEKGHSHQSLPDLEPGSRPYLQKLPNA